ncbi:TIR domain-containing protein [Aliarcobacter cryaerophilus]|uniref:TIR domain-containing protein n=1 Tax=Aliarcobacter cryaerophilus TaxID=28198 RepID=UPI0019CF7F53|nr:nucleotide-binding protein [Aliarcobacter cryaerophilus]
MIKMKALEKLNTLLQDIEKLEFSTYQDLNPELDKFIFRGKRFLKDCFGENSTYFKEFSILKYHNENSWVYNEEIKRINSNNKYYKDDLITAKTIIESATEEVNEWDNTTEENYLNQINYFLRSINILELENKFQRFGVNEHFEKLKIGLEYFLKISFGENSDELNRFKRIKFLYSGPRGYDGLQVPLDISTYKDGLKLTKILLDTIKDNISRNGLIKNQPINTQIISETKKNISNKVFIVHGHDELIITQVSELLRKLGLEPIILKDEANNGDTIIEKIERLSSNVGFGIVLYTACDIGGKDKDDLKARARQNVVLEHGYLMARIGRKNTVALVKDKVETPSDISGLLYTPVDEHKAWQYKLVDELKASGYNVSKDSI